MGFVVGGGGTSRQTPWTSNIDGGGFSLTHVSQVGIGTASPQVTLQAVGVSQGVAMFESTDGKTGISASQITLRSLAGGYGSGVVFQSKEVGTNTVLSQATIESEGEASWSSVANAYSMLRFSTIATGVLGERMRITGSGNVGIGTTSPTVSGTGKIHCSGDTARITDASRTPANSAAPGNDGEICFDSGFVYIHSGGSWRRAALATF